MLCIIVSCVCLVFCLLNNTVCGFHCETNRTTAQLLAKVDQQQLEAFQ